MENPFDIITEKLDKIEQRLIHLEKLKVDVSQEKFMSIAECAAFLNLAKQTIYQKVSRNEIPYMKKAGRLFFSKNDIEGWLKEGRRISGEEAGQILEMDIVSKRRNTL